MCSIFGYFFLNYSNSVIVVCLVLAWAAATSQLPLSAGGVPVIEL